MSSRQKSPVTRPTRRRLTSQRRLYRAQGSSRTIVNGGSTSSCSSVSKKLEALRSLIPSHNGEREADQLFQETAEYIVLLKTQLSILQRLVDIYGSKSNQTQNAVW